MVRVERRTDRSPLRLTVPPAVGELFAEKSFDDAVDVLAEVSPEGEGVAVDAWLYFAVEVVLAVMVPFAVVPNQLHCSASLFTLRVETHIAQER